MKRLDKEDFVISKDVDHLTERLFLITSRDKLEAGNLERRLKQDTSGGELLRKVKKVPFLVAVGLFVSLLVLPIFDHDQIRQQKCLAMLVGITSLWVSEGLPYFATALLVPPLVVFLELLDDPANPGTVLTSRKCSSSDSPETYNYNCLAEKAAKKGGIKLLNIN